MLIWILEKTSKSYKGGAPITGAEPVRAWETKQVWLRVKRGVGIGKIVVALSRNKGGGAKGRIKGKRAGDWNKERDRQEISLSRVYEELKSSLSGNRSFIKSFQIDPETNDQWTSAYMVGTVENRGRRRSGGRGTLMFRVN